jgi:hypothetical protein
MSSVLVCFTNAMCVHCRFQTCLQILPSQFSLLTIIERLGNQGSLGGINAVLGCPLHLPSTKVIKIVLET